MKETMDIIFAIAVLAGTINMFMLLIFPFYLAIYVYRHIRSIRLGPDARPAIDTLVIYIMLIGTVTLPHFIPSSGTDRLDRFIIDNQGLIAIYTIICPVALFYSMHRDGKRFKKSLEKGKTG
jgi:hypothetical protein